MTYQKCPVCKESGVNQSDKDFWDKAIIGQEEIDKYDKHTKGISLNKIK